MNRTRIPREMNALFPAKVLVGTGPSHKDNGCMEEVEIEVNLIPSGELTTLPPANPVWGLINTRIQWYTTK